MRAHAGEHDVLGHAAGTRFAAPAAPPNTDPAAFGADSLVADATGRATADKIVGRATSTGHGVSIGGGVVRVGRYESVAEASSDGATGAGHAGTVAEGVTVNGINAVLDQSGLHAAGADLTPAERAALDNQITAALKQNGLDIRVASASGGPDAGTPALGGAVAGGILVTYVGPEQVTRRYSFGSVMAGALAYGTASPLPEEAVLPGEPPGTPGVGIPATGTFSVNPAPVPAPAPARVSRAVQRQAAVLGSASGALAGRRGVGAWALLAGLGAVMLVTGGLGYARWQLLDGLPAPEG